MKKILLVNDLSCIGKVALSATLPIFSCLEIESDLLPTVLLSTHTGGFGHNTKLTFDDEMQKITTHWQSFNYSCDAILTGYFGNSEQIHTFLKNMPPHQFLAVDPVMADNGILYSSFDSNYPHTMKLLCQKASIIFPNLTEAHLLLSKSYQHHLTKQQIYHLLLKLQNICPNIVLTGIQTSQTTIGVAYLYNGQFNIIENQYITAHFFGSGDIFSALVTGLLIKNYPIENAITIALQFLVNCLNTTIKMNRPIRFGIAFEPHLHELLSLTHTKGEYYDKQNN